MLRQHLSSFALGGVLYGLVELLYRGRTHPAMLLAGGLCFLLVGRLDEAVPGMPVLLQTLAGAALITAVELAVGLLWNGDGAIWNYSRCPLNFRGQICLQYTLLWVPLALAAILADDRFRRRVFGRPLPDYRWV